MEGGKYNFRANRAPKRSSSYIYPSDSQTYCICNSVDDHTRYINCDSCGEWYHVRCSGIPEVLPGFVSGEIKSTCIKFFCGLGSCFESESTVVYTKGKTMVKHKVSIMSRKESSAQQDDVEDSSVDLEIEKCSDIFIMVENDENEIERGSVNIGKENKVDSVTLGIEKESEQKFHFEEDISDQYEKPVEGLNNETDKRKVLGENTLSDLSGVNISKSGDFSTDLTPVFSCLIERTSWDSLVLNNLKYSGKRKFFKGGSWQKLFINIIKRTNPYCTIMFKRHEVFIASKRTARNNIVFRAEGYCKQTSCLVKKVKIVLHDEEALRCVITFHEPKVVHKLEVTTARPFRGEDRKIEAKLIKETAPLKEYALRLGNQEGDVFASGNRDCCGRSPSVLKQIIYENRTDGRLSGSELDSLMMLKKEYTDKDVSNSSVKGFIHFISVDPVIVFFWTRGAVRVFHDLCKYDAVFWDATGHVVKTSLTERKLFYYELTVRNPTTGKVSLPVAMMISSD